MLTIGRTFTTRGNWIPNHFRDVSSALSRAYRVLPVRPASIPRLSGKKNAQKNHQIIMKQGTNPGQERMQAKDIRSPARASGRNFRNLCHLKIGETTAPRFPQKSARSRQITARSLNSLDFKKSGFRLPRAGREKQHCAQHCLS